MGFLDRLFGKKQAAPHDGGIYFYVRCDKCGRVLHTRLDPERELSPRDEGGYEVKKEMMDDRCFRRIFLLATFDEGKRSQGVEVRGGSLIERSTWEAEKDLPRRPAATESSEDL